MGDDRDWNSGVPLPRIANQQIASYVFGKEQACMSDKLPNYYEILGVPKNATGKEITAKYAELIQKYHPDKIEGLKNKYKATNDSALLNVLEQAIEQAEEKAKLLNEAYRVLSNPDKRKLYDSTLVYIEIKPSKLSFGSIAQGRKVDLSFTIENKGGTVSSINIDWLREPTWGEIIIGHQPPPDIFPIKVTVSVSTVGLSPDNYEEQIVLEADRERYNVPVNFRVIAVPKVVPTPKKGKPALSQWKLATLVLLITLLIIAATVLERRKIGDIHVPPQSVTLSLPTNSLVLNSTQTPYHSPTPNFAQTTVSLVEVTQTPRNENSLPQNVRARLPNDYEFKNIPSIWDANNITPLDLHLPGLRSYNVTVKFTDRLIWAYYWCASDIATLQENLEHLSVHFLIDNYDLSKSQILLTDREITDWSCKYWGTLLSNWKVGTVIQLDIKYSFSDAIFDGYDNYQPGDYFFRLIVSVK